MVLAAWLIKFYIEFLVIEVARITSSSRIQKREFILVHRGVNISVNYQGHTSFLLFESLSFNNTYSYGFFVKVEQIIFRFLTVSNYFQVFRSN